MIPRLKGMYNCVLLSNFFKKLNIDIIHSFHYGSDYSEAISAKIAGIPWVFTKKNMSWGGSSKNSWKLRSYLASQILVQNRDMLFFYKNKTVNLVPRGVSNVNFLKSNKINLREVLEIGKNKKIIISVSNLVYVKGIHVLIDAFELICENDSSFHLIIVGDTRTLYGQEMKQKALKSDYSNKINFIGKVNNVKDYLSIADLFVLPTLDEGRKEGSPVALLEAMAIGLNVLASKIAGIKDILSNFPENMFTPGDKKNLFTAILREFSDSQQNKGKLLSSHVRENYSLMKEVTSHQEIYKKCIKT